MPTVHFSANLQRHISTCSMEVAGSRVGAALEAVFSQRPELRSFVVDEQDALRTHIVVFADGRTVVDRDRLTDPVTANAVLHVMQALSGG